jgi:hypothetical protein
VSAGVYLFTVPLALAAIIALLIGIAVLMPWKGLTARG